MNAKQQRFAEEYIVDLNATQAAVRAGYSAKTAYSIAEQILRKPEIQQLIIELQGERSRRTEISADAVIKELARVAFGDARRVMSWGPGGIKLVDSSALSDDDAAMVSEVSETVTQAGGSLKLKTHDKLKALDLLGRHLGMWNDKMELTGPNGTPIGGPVTVVYVD